MRRKLTIRQLQAEHKEWSERNFPDNQEVAGILGVNEESGELAHAYLKKIQGIRGTEAEHVAAMKDALGDIIIYICQVCNTFDFDLQNIIDDTWAEVQQRDWQKNKKDGK